MGVQNEGKDFKKEEKYLGVIIQNTLTPKRNINVLLALTYSILTKISKCFLITWIRWKQS